jgi:hypothetical protein
VVLNSSYYKQNPVSVLAATIPVVKKLSSGAKKLQKSIFSVISVRGLTFTILPLNILQSQRSWSQRTIYAITQTTQLW